MGREEGSKGDSGISSVQLGNNIWWKQAIQDINRAHWIHRCHVLPVSRLTFQSQRDEQVERTHRGRAQEEGPTEGLERSLPLRGVSSGPKAH